MIDNFYEENFEYFIDWYFNLNSTETLDIHEAMLIYFNLEDYEILGV